MTAQTHAIVSESDMSDYRVPEIYHRIDMRKRPEDTHFYYQYNMSLQHWCYGNKAGATAEEKRTHRDNLAWGLNNSLFSYEGSNWHFFRRPRDPIEFVEHANLYDFYRHIRFDRNRRRYLREGEDFK